ncbi:MAG TPA: hypothetical protein PKL84_02865, partial [Candidatus Hydrogenedentes bacterium]|nr:hypothetical protein [Candidatus Hydrogenedentota bacterium]
LTGAADLLPAFLGLSATAMYVRSARGARGGHGAAASRAYVSALAVFACAVLPFRGNLLLIAPLICHEFLLKKRDRRSPARLAPFTAIALAAFVAHGIASPPEVPAPLRLFAPLGLLFYPIGLLPETAGRFVAHPLLAYGAAALAIAALVFLERRVRLPAFTFALISMVLVRAGQDRGFIDPVHMTGGGALLLPLGFFAVGAAALCERIMRHPKWPKPMVLLTTALCVLLFLLQWGAIMSWRHAAREAARFRQQATAFATAHPNEVLGVLPDFQCFRGAPMMLSESIAHDTPFSRRVPHVSLLPMHYVGRKKAHITVAAWEPEEGVIRVDGARPVAVAPWPYTPEQTWPARAAVEVRLGEITDHGFDLRIRDRAGPLPRRLLPVINDATKPDSDDVAAAASPDR